MYPARTSMPDPRCHSMTKIEYFQYSVRLAKQYEEFLDEHGFLEPTQSMELAFLVQREIKNLYP